MNSTLALGVLVIRTGDSPNYLSVILSSHSSLRTDDMSFFVLSRRELKDSRGYACSRLEDLTGRGFVGLLPGCDENTALIPSANPDVVIQVGCLNPALQIPITCTLKVRALKPCV
jgi:hypothetical protein